MDKRRTKVFRDKLLDRREGLVGQVQAAELYSRERDAEATQDPADMAANAYTKELLVSMSDNDRQLLNLIDEALERIETSGYGKCVHCGEALPEKRLEAVPWARHCVRCQDLQERGLLEGSPRDIGALIKEVPADISKECADEIKDKLFAWAWPHIQRMTTRGLPEWYKEQLLKQQFEREVTA